MAHIARFSATTQKIAKPGYDVLSATDSQLIFNGSGKPTNGVLFRGTAPSGNFTETSARDPTNSGTIYTRTCVINFGRLIVNPRAFVGYFDPYVTSNPFTTRAAIASNIGIGTGNNTGASLYYHYSCSNTALMIYCIYTYFNGSGFSRTVSFQYLVFTA